MYIVEGCFIVTCKKALKQNDSECGVDMMDACLHCILIQIVQ